MKAFQVLRVIQDVWLMVGFVCLFVLLFIKALQGLRVLLVFLYQINSLKSIYEGAGLF